MKYTHNLRLHEFIDTDFPDFPRASTSAGIHHPAIPQLANMLIEVLSQHFTDTTMPRSMSSSNQDVTPGTSRQRVLSSSREPVRNQRNFSDTTRPRSMSSSSQGVTPGTSRQRVLSSSREPVRNQRNHPYREVPVYNPPMRSPLAPRNWNDQPDVYLSNKGKPLKVYDGHYFR